MKFITVRDIRTTPSQIWKELPDEQEMVITNNGRPIALLTPLTDENLEDTLAAVRQARATQAVARMQQAAGTSGAAELTVAEIDAEIQRARAGRTERNE
jgi:antitoxin (DNA-binding transcriptional repressor) of toxin-antitoxin stability system